MVEECLDSIRECLEIGWTGSGYKTTQFEEAWSTYNEIDETIFVASNTAGIDLTIRGMKIHYCWEDDDEIISTALTFVSANHSILLNGLSPIFADVDETLCLDPNSVENLINSKTKAVIYTGIGGNSANLEKIREICNQKSIALIIDAAHMAGTSLRGKSIASIGDATIYSFQSVKNLPTADSGAIYIRDSELRDSVRKLSWLGISSDTFTRTKSGAYKWEYEVEDIGLKANGNSIMAAIAIEQLRVLDRDNEMRRAIVLQYKEGIKESKDLSWVEVPDPESSSCHLAQIIVKMGLREKLIDYLDSIGIDTGVHYRLNSRYPMYAHLYCSTPRAEDLESQILSLPLHLRLTKDDISRVVSGINDFFEEVENG